MKKLNLVGERYGKLTVIEEAQKRGNKVAWKCLCDCGKYTIVTTHDLRAGSTHSCGCLQRESRKLRKTKHGEADTRLYRTWRNMKARCYVKSCNGYFRYGGRGITVCDEWRDDFSAFSNWAYLNGYSETADRKDCTIDRIDNDKGYSPENCRWVSMKEQCKNRHVGNQYVRYYNPLTNEVKRSG